jgi:hypothetical protein
MKILAKLCPHIYACQCQESSYILLIATIASCDLIRDKMSSQWSHIIKGWLEECAIAKESRDRKVCNYWTKEEHKLYGTDTNNGRWPLDLIQFPTFIHCCSCKEIGKINHLSYRVLEHICTQLFAYAKCGSWFSGTNLTWNLTYHQHIVGASLLKESSIMCNLVLVLGHRHATFPTVWAARFVNPRASRAKERLCNYARYI